MKSILKHKKYHLIVWLAYFIFWSSFSILYYHTYWLHALLFTVIWFLGQAFLSYSCLYLSFPRYFNNKKYVAFIISSLVLLVLSSLLITGLGVAVVRYIMHNTKFSLQFFWPYVLMANVYTLFWVIAAKFIRDRIVFERRTRLLEKERTENELRSLRSQMNPHFLFNAINSIYVLIKKDPDEAARTLATFADMLRFQLYECNVNEVSIDKEITYLNNYIGIESLRKGNALSVDYYVENTVSGFSIAPVIIIPFVENAFKYVSNHTDDLNTVTIHLTYQNNIFCLLVENSTDAHTDMPSDRTDRGIGLENVQRRLELLYKGKYNLDIRKEQNKYTATLNIQIP